MQTITVSTDVYTLEELDSSAQEKAHEEYLNHGFEYFWQDENRNTLTAFCEWFDVKEVHHFNAVFKADTVDCTGNRLRTWILNNYGFRFYRPKVYKSQTGKKWTSCILEEYQLDDCPLTGYCMDYDILEPIMDFLKRPAKGTEWQELIDDCIRSWELACDRDYEYQRSFESFKETCACNEWLFTSDGKWFR